MTLRSLTAREDVRHAWYWRVASIVIAVHFAIGVFLWVSANFMMSGAAPLALAGLTLAEKAMVASVFWGWIIHAVLLTTDLIAFWIMYARMSAQARRRASNGYLALVLLVVVGHAALMLAALSIGTFRGAARTFVIDSWISLVPMLVINLILGLPATIVWVGTRFRVRDGACIRCGYDLVGITGRCPECGESTHIVHSGE